MDILWEELTSGLPDRNQLIHVIVRLLASAILGAAIGFQREHARKPAGLRTHILVCMGTTVFILTSTGVGMPIEDMSRVIQGIATGIGFIGAGSILKLNEDRDIQGLTTAAGIWMTAAIGVAIGLGTLGLALLSTVLTLGILALAGPHGKQDDPQSSDESTRSNKS